MIKHLESELKNAILWIDQNLQITKQEVQDERTLIALGCLDLAIEHQAATLALYKAGLLGTMFAIQRSLFEGVLRGVWFEYCAMDEEILKYMEGSGTPNFEKMIIGMEKKLPDELLPLRSYREKVEGPFHHFVHSGYRHIIRRHRAGVVGPNYSDKDIEQVLKHATVLGLQAAERFATIIGNETVAKQARHRIVAYGNLVVSNKK